MIKTTQKQKDFVIQATLSQLANINPLKELTKNQADLICCNAETLMEALNEADYFDPSSNCE